MTDLNHLLREAAQAGDRFEVGRLLSEGADPNSDNDRQETSLIYVGRFGFVNIDPIGSADLLIKAGANVNHVSQITGDSPLNAACEAPNPKLVKLLLRHGARAAANPKAMYCLYNSVNMEIIQALLHHGAHPLDVGIEGVSPLENSRRLLDEAIKLKDYKVRIAGFSKLVEVLERHSRRNS